MLKAEVQSPGKAGPPKDRKPSLNNWKQVIRRDPRDFGADCLNCPFAKEGVPSNPVWGEGPEDPDGLLVGEGPGRDEAEKGRPFVGPTGVALDAELLRAGLVRSQLLVVNATCCQPKFPKVEKEMKQAVVCCRPAFLHQVKDLDPNTPMLAMGRWASFAITLIEKGVMNGRGFLRWQVTVPKQRKKEEKQQPNISSAPTPG